MREIDAQMRLGWLVSQIDDTVLERAGLLRLYQLCPRADHVSSDTIAKARGIVAEVRVWGIGGSTQSVIDLIRAVVEAGCDGMTINWPDWAVNTT
jgi:glycerophosphoryl diester phosphodiesterase